MIEELKQRVTAKTAKVKRYKERIKQFRKNKLFQTDQSRLYQELNGEDRSGVSPDKDEAKFFGVIYGAKKSIITVQQSG